MNILKKVLKKRHKQLITLGLFTLLLVFSVQAQTSMGELKTDNAVHSINYNADKEAMDYTIPASTTVKKLYLTVRGADGGAGRKNGGSGANVQGVVNIGTGNHEVPPGSTIRFIIGQKGGANPDHGGGGGGSAIAFKAPGSSEWTLLMVAGGGGGAGAKYAGRPGNEGENGSGGIGVYNYKEDDAGSNGQGGGKRDSYGGGGAYGDGSGEYNDKAHTTQKGGKAGYQNNEPTGGVGGTTSHPNGGFGFGGGGGAGSGMFLGIEDSGGGGGGYSGGGGGDANGGGGGGGSYANPDWVDMVTKVENGTTADAKDGYGKYQFINSVSAILSKGHEYHSAATLLTADSYRLVWQGDGNLVLYEGGTARWSTKTNGKGAKLAFQGDGNLVVYDSAGKAIWTSATADAQKGGKGGQELVLTPYGDLSIQNIDGKIIWQTNISG